MHAWVGMSVGMRRGLCVYERERNKFFRIASFFYTIVERKSRILTIIMMVISASSYLIT